MKQSKTFIALILSVLLLAVFASSVCAQAASLALRIDKIELDDVELKENASNLLDIQRGQEVELRVTFTALDNLKNLQLEGFIAGFEYSDIAPLSAQTRVFDADANVTYVRKLTLKISDEVQEDSYKLRLLLTDRNSAELIKNYNLKIDVPRNGLKVEDVVFFPDGVVEAGKGLLSTVRLQNMGERDQTDVRVQVSIPDLGVSGVDYIDEVRKDREKGTEEIFIQIPASARSGKYAVRIDVDYNQLHDHITAVRDIQVIGGSASGSSSTGSSNSGNSGTVDNKPAEPKTIITVNSQLESVTPGKGGALYPITVVNNDEGSRAYSLVVSGADWADVKVSPSSTQLVERGEAKLFSVYVTPKDGQKAGPQSLTISVSSNGKTLKEIPLTANITAPEAPVKSDVVRILEVVFILLLVILVVIGLIIAFRRKESQDNGAVSKDNSQTYY